jgi:hypothetical protein
VRAAVEKKGVYVVVDMICFIFKHKWMFYSLVVMYFSASALEGLVG